MVLLQFTNDYKPKELGLEELPHPSGLKFSIIIYYIMVYYIIPCCRARVWKASARTPTSTRRGSGSSSSRRRSECKGSQNWSTCDMKLVYGQYGCFVAALSLLACIDDAMK